MSFVVMRFLLVRRSCSFFVYSSQVSKHPPAGEGYVLMPNCLASSNWGFLDLPWIASSLFLSTKPFFSASVWGNSLAESGRRSLPFSPASFSMICSAG